MPIAIHGRGPFCSLVSAYHYGVAASLKWRGRRTRTEGQRRCVINSVCSTTICFFGKTKSLRYHQTVVQELEKVRLFISARAACLGLRGGNCLSILVMNGRWGLKSVYKDSTSMWYVSNSRVYAECWTGNGSILAWSGTSVELTSVLTRARWRTMARWEVFSLQG